jgi:uncharacterized protein (DUF305 family)
MKSKIFIPLFLSACLFILASCSNKNNSHDTEMKSPMVGGTDTSTHHNMPMDHDMMASMNMSMQKMESMEMTGEFDLDFAKMMIIHHQSAIDMSEMEIANGKNDEMKLMAQKMITVQKEEISQFQNIINNYKAKSGQDAHHGDGNHKELGESMKAMNAKMKNMVMTGDTDKDFVMMMIPHHEGAIVMAEAEINHGAHKELKQIAGKIITDQKKEIDALKAWQAKHN